MLINGFSLKCESLVRLGRDNEGKIQAVLDDGARDRIDSARAGMEAKVMAGETVYGTTTGVNVLKCSPAPTGKAKLAQAAGNAGR